MEAVPRAAPEGILIGIQLLRGLAALLVILAHANLMMRYPRYFGASPFDIHDSGIFGVTIFFVISGFIIAIVSLDGAGRPKLTVSDYAWRRFVRIVPFLWVAVIGYNLLSYAGTHQIEWAPMLRALVAWPIGALKPNVVWSLRHEFLFYALFAIALLGRRKHVWLLILWFVAPLAYGGALLVTHGAAAPADPRLAELANTVLMGGDNGANLQFGTGFLLGWLRLRGSPLVAPRLRGGLITVLLVTAAATVFVEAASLPMGLARSCLWTLLAGVIVWLGVISLNETGLVARAGMLIGNASFAIYLTHNGVLLPVFEAIRHVPAALALPHGLLFLLFAAIALSAGILVHLAVEKPLIAALARRRPVAPWQRAARDRPLSADGGGGTAG